MILTFAVRQQDLVALPRVVSPRQGSAGYLKLKFNFSSDWANLRKTLYISSGDYAEPYELTTESFQVPRYYTQQESFNITLLGDSEGVVVPTNVLTVTLEASNNLWRAEPPDPENSAYLQLLQMVADHEDRLELLEKFGTGGSGFSPIAKVEQTATGAVISITDKDGTTTATITNGKDGVDGADGKDGYTPQKNVDYFDGKDGKDGKDGDDYVLTPADKTEIAEMAAELVEVPSDEHINSLINTALGVIENGTY